MNRWPTKPLADLATDLQPGFACRPSETGRETRQIRPLNLTELGTLTLEGTKSVGCSEAQKKKYSLEPSDVLFNNTNSPELVGKVAVFTEHGDFVFSNHITRIRVRKNELLPEFLHRFLFKTWSEGFFQHHCTQWINQAAFNVDTLARLPVPVPRIEEQKKIVGALDGVDQLRNLRTQADRRTADLIPALFHEIFGSPTSNPFRWPVERVGSLFDQKRGGAKCGPFGSALKKHEYVEAGIPVWGIPNVLPNRFIEKDSLFISPSKFEELQAYSIEPGDLLFSRAGTVGRICVARPKANCSIIGTNLIRLALDNRRIIPEFFSTLMTHFGKDVGGLRANSDEGAYSFMNTTVLNTLLIYVPPLPLQQEFAKGVMEIRELEAKQAASRERLDALFQSMLHRAFNGDL